jgi:predicted N-acetyltransferase YhbS
MNIRQATPGDLGAIVAVKVEAIRPIYEPTGSEALASDYDVREQRPWLAHLLATIDEDSPFLVALDDVEQVIGWIRLGRDWEGGEDAAEIKGLFVSPSHQGDGIGRCLVGEGCRVMSKRGSRHVKVQTLANSRACDFYQGIGGRHDGDVPFRAQFKESVYRWDDIGLLANDA